MPRMVSRIPAPPASRANLYCLNAPQRKPFSPAPFEPIKPIMVPKPQRYIALTFRGPICPPGSATLIPARLPLRVAAEVPQMMEERGVFGKLPLLP